MVPPPHKRAAECAPWEVQAGLQAPDTTHTLGPAAIPPHHEKTNAKTPPLRTKLKWRGRPRATQVSHFNKHTALTLDLVLLPPASVARAEIRAC